MKIKTWLPVFHGFYNTLLSPDENDETMECERYDCEYDDLKFNNTEYEKAVSIHCCSLIETKLKELSIINSIEYENVSSPKEYNFTNDSINCEIDVNWDELQKYIMDNKDDFEGYLKETYTSYDGFMSFHSNNLIDWTKDLFTPETMEKIEHKVGSFLQFICQMEEIDMDYLFEETYETRSISEYCEHDLEVVIDN